MLAAVVGHAHYAETKYGNLQCRLTRTQYTMSLDTCYEGTANAALTNAALFRNPRRLILS